jgi:hypothetical protein
METAQAMRRLADGIDKVITKQGKDADTGKPKPMLEDELAVGAAAFLIYLRDMITSSPRDTWDKPTLLVLLETMSRDDEIFPCGCATVLWNADED